MAANNEIGTIQPVAAIGRLCRERGVAVPFRRGAGDRTLPAHVEDWCADLVSLSAHKMYGPKGVGALYVRRSRRPRLRLQAQAEGGGQEKGLRSGTLNVPGIVGFGEAARLAAEALAAGEAERVAVLRDRLLSGLRARLEGVEVNGAMDRRLPGNLHVSVARAEAETLILSLGGQIAISSGAACAEAGGKGSHVLRALGLADERVYTSLRFGIGRFNDAHEIDTTVDGSGRSRWRRRGIARRRRRDEARYGPDSRRAPRPRGKNPITQIACLGLAAVTECKTLQDKWSE